MLDLRDERPEVLLRKERLRFGILYIEQTMIYIKMLEWDKNSILFISSV